MAAIREAAEMAEEDLPTRSPRGDGPPVPRAWAEKDPVAARRLELARTAMTALAEEHHLPVENLLTPDYLRRTLWAPPATRAPGELLDQVVAQLSGLGARSWQISLTAPVVVAAILDADADAKAAAIAATAAATAPEPEPDEDAVEDVEA
jgi:ribonuclease D